MVILPLNPKPWCDGAREFGFNSSGLGNVVLDSVSLCLDPKPTAL